MDSEDALALALGHKLLRGLRRVADASPSGAVIVYYQTRTLRWSLQIDEFERGDEIIELRNHTPKK